MKIKDSLVCLKRNKMKILIVSDIHGSREASKKIASLDSFYNFSRIIILGDVNYSGARNVPPLDYYPIDVCKNLSKLKEKLTIIRGNCDSRVDEFVLGLQFKDLLKEKVNGHNFIMTHGDLYEEKDFDFNDNDVFLYGHTHVFKLEKHDNHFFINPGSTTLPKENNVKSYMIYDLEKDCITLYSLLDDSVIKTLELH